MAGQELQPDDQPTEGDGSGGLARATLHLSLNYRQNRRQPDGRADDHRPEEADHEIAAEPERQPGDHAAEPGRSERPGEPVRTHRPDPQVQRDEPTVGRFHGHHVEQNAQRVQRTVLTGSHERLATQNVRVPERQLAGGEALAGETLPRVVLEDRVSDKRIVRQTDAKIVGVGLPGRVAEQCVNWQERAAGQQRRPNER